MNVTHYFKVMSENKQELMINQCFFQVEHTFWENAFQVP